MEVTIASIFRNSASYLDRYFSQIEALREATRKVVNIKVIGTWGDCDDNTGDLLGANRDISVTAYHHGGPHFGSVDHPPRWDQIAGVVRHTLDRVPRGNDVLIWVESDLIWEPVTMLGLLDDLSRVNSVAPMCIANNERRFYDVWGYRENGAMFNAMPPYFTQEPDRETGLVKIDSCGSCFVTDGDAWRDWSGHWPFQAGGNLWLDTGVSVVHP